MSRGYNQADQRYDSFYGNQNQRGNYGLSQQGFNNQNQNMFSNMQQQNLLSALLDNQNMGFNQFQGSVGPRRDGNMNGFSRGMGRGTSHGIGRGVSRGASHGAINGASRGSSRGGYGGVARPGDKRSSSHSLSNRGAKKSVPLNKKPNQTKPKPKEKDVEEDIEIPDEDVVVSEELKLTVEKLRERTEEIERNAVDEDVEKLKVFSFNGKAYRCASCDLILTKEASFSNHIMSKTHAMKVIDVRTSKKYQDVRTILDINLNNDEWFEESDLAKSILILQAKEDMKVTKLKELKALKNYNSTPSNFYRYGMGSRKSAILVGDEVLISTLVESTLAVKANDFVEASRFGCEFVNPVSGFHCRLCSTHIHKDVSVTSHVAGKTHRSNYAAHLAKNKEYQKVQKTLNEELLKVIKENEEDDIVLTETKSVEKCRFLSQLDSNLLRIPSVMNLHKKGARKGTAKDTKEKSVEQEEKEKEKDEDKTVEGEEAADDEETSKDEETKDEETKDEETKDEETKDEETKDEETKDEETKDEETKDEKTEE